MKEVLQEKVVVDSSLIHTLIYDYQQQTLEVHFRKGKVRKYKNFHADEYKSILEAKSPGKRFMSVVKRNRDIVKIEPTQRKKSVWTKLFGL